MKTWEIVAKRWETEEGIYSKPNKLMSVGLLHEIAKNEIFDLLDRIKELEAVCNDMNNYIDNLDLWEDEPPDELQDKIKEMVYGPRPNKSLVDELLPPESSK